MRPMWILLAGLLTITTAPEPTVEMVVPHGEAQKYWPRWRGPSGQGHVNGTGYLDTWSDTQNVLWKIPAPGRGNSSPIVWGDHLFIVTSYDGGARKSIVAFDRRDGKQLWETFAPQADAEQSNPKNGHASGTPTTDGTRVYAYMGNHGLFAVDFKGRQLWHRSLGTFQAYHGTAGSPLLYKDRLILYQDQKGGSGSFVAAFDAKTGNELWRTARQAQVGWGTPIAIRTGTRDEVIVSSMRRVHAYDPNNGAELWSAGGNLFEVIPTPVVGEGFVFCTSGRAGPTLAIRPGGSGDVTATHIAWKAEKGSPFVPSPLLHEGILYMINDMVSIATAYDAKTGTVLWQGRLGEAARESFSSSPVVVDGKVYLTNDQGETFVVATGREFKLLHVNWLNARTLASPALVDGKWYWRTDKELLAIGRKLATRVRSICHAYGMADPDSSFPGIDERTGRAVLDLVRGCTFDDFILAPQRSVLVRRDPAVIDLSCKLSRRITLKRPIVSANMDTVTRAPMAIVQAEEGGIGIIDRGFRPGEIDAQVREVEKVKRTQHGVIPDPYSIEPSATIADADALMSRSRVGTLVVTGPERRLLGLLTERDVRFVRDPQTPVSQRMTPVDRLVLHRGPLSFDEAESQMVERKVKKLPLVDREGRLTGLITARDLVRQRRLPFATRDAQGRLRVGAAIGATGDYLERAAELIRAGVDVLVIDIAHGHSVVMERAMKEFRKRFGDFELIAGNVATAEGARFLLDLGADGVKVGIGPGGGCTTRMTTSFGVPQLHALVECRLAVAASGIPIVADGGIKRHGALAEALVLGGDSAMLGSAFAGTEEAPGEVVHKTVLLPESQKTVKVPFKVLRGMASLEAIRDRLDVEDADKVELEAIGAEGIEISVPSRGSARSIVRDMLKHLCSSISYGGAASLSELRRLFWADPQRFMIRQSQSARRESYER